MKKIKAGYYKLDNGFLIVKYDGVWVATYPDFWKYNRFLSEGYDQIFTTLSDARKYLEGIQL